MNDGVTNASDTETQSTAVRPKWQRPEIAVLDVERGTLGGNGGSSDGSANTTS